MDNNGCFIIGRMLLGVSFLTKPVQMQNDSQDGRARVEDEKAPATGTRSSDRFCDRSSRRCRAGPVVVQRHDQQRLDDRP